MRINGTRRADDLVGTSGDDLIMGFRGSDRITDGAGDDMAFGASGNDTFFLGQGADYLHGGSGGGDTVIVDTRELDLPEGSSLFFYMKKSLHGVAETSVGRDTFISIENYRLRSDQDLVVYCNDAANEVWGGGGDDQLRGRGGDDRLFGGSGRDDLRGGSGADRIFGGGGSDRIEGGTGFDLMVGGHNGDRFVFRTSGEIGRGADSDRIADFDGAEGDRIDLSKMDANSSRPGHQDFRIASCGAFSGAAGELLVESTSVSGDLDGDSRADFRLLVEGATSDFLLL